MPATVPAGPLDALPFGPASPRQGTALVWYEFQAEDDHGAEGAGTQRCDVRVRVQDGTAEKVIKVCCDALNVRLDLGLEPAGMALRVDEGAADGDSDAAEYLVGPCRLLDHRAVRAAVDTGSEARLELVPPAPSQRRQSAAVPEPAPRPLDAGGPDPQPPPPHPLPAPGRAATDGTPPDNSLVPQPQPPSADELVAAGGGAPDDDDVVREMRQLQWPKPAAPLVWQAAAAAAEERISRTRDELRPLQVPDTSCCPIGKDCLLGPTPARPRLEPPRPPPTPPAPVAATEAAEDSAVHQELRRVSAMLEEAQLQRDEAVAQQQRALDEARQLMREAESRAAALQAEVAELEAVRRDAESLRDENARLLRQRQADAEREQLLEAELLRLQQELTAAALRPVSPARPGADLPCLPETRPADWLTRQLQQDDAVRADLSPPRRVASPPPAAVESPPAPFGVRSGDSLATIVAKLTGKPSLGDEVARALQPGLPEGDVTVTVRESPPPTVSDSPPRSPPRVGSPSVAEVVVVAPRGQPRQQPPPPSPEVLPPPPPPGPPPGASGQPPRFGPGMGSGLGPGSPGGPRPHRRRRRGPAAAPSPGAPGTAPPPPPGPPPWYRAAAVPPPPPGPPPLRAYGTRPPGLYSP
eukprot:TRINITY_DN1788_c2_g1_i3.p1 TRINITY_DN1788_c2_g1~~TRINITY_DN1788_c2_g1_i3.p1  ORF type:complete len:658 (+),score=242.28 TRINITY_DN1788_c2_g1_i3:55-1974(+)